MSDTQSRFVLTLSCPDTIGIVAAVSQFLAERGLSISESHQFNDALSQSFHMRAEFSPHGVPSPPLAELEGAFAGIARRFKMNWAVHDATVRPRIVIAVSKFGHCLNDLLHRWKGGMLHADIAAVVSNHEDMRSFTDWNGLPFIHLPVARETKAAQEAQLLEVMRESKAELLVLARYMQILSAAACATLAGRCINIHHSFLPGFKGAKPYHQAHARGVKIIGATAHYVTADLDEGPIIEQAVERVAHQQTPDDLVEIGRDLECTVLARAVRWHVERRVIVHGPRTIVFR